MKRGQSTILMDNVIYLVLAAIFMVGMLAFVSGQSNGSDIWTQYYSEEVARILDYSQPGDKISVPIDRASKIAQSNDVELSEMFVFDNSKGMVGVKLSEGRRSYFTYFTDFDVVSCEIEFGLSDDVENTLRFEIVEDRGTDFFEECEIV